MADMEFVQTDAAAGAKFSPTGCWAGIDRWKGASNKKSTIDSVMAAGSLWEDPEFPADDTSISWEMFGYGSMGNSNSDGVAESLPMGMPWKRPSEMGQGLSANPSLMGDLGKPMPQGINQGGVLADCWFMASMSAIAEQPDRILNNMYNR